MKSQIEVYRAKAKEYARLTILTKSLRAVDTGNSRKCIGHSRWKDFLYMRPEAEIDQRIIANALWIALAPLRKFNNLLRDNLGRDIVLI